MTPKNKNPNIETFKAYMNGWKHGASANTRYHNEGEYVIGYEEGLQARVEAQRKAAERYGVSVQDLLNMVLR